MIRLKLLLVLFVVSGFAGLIYQSIWSHYLGLFLGHAAYAQALVLAIFMGGMALGAALIARSGHRWRNLVRGYAVVELVIGLFGLVFHLVFVAALGLSYDVIMPALGASWAVNSYKWLLAGLLILPQTVLLGMTFPLMAGGIIRRYPGQDGQALGGFYFANSIGAAVGVLVAAFVLLPSVGLPGAMITAGLLNIAVGVAAWFLSASRETPRPSEDLSNGPVLSESRQRLLKIVLAATFFSSAASFAYEILFVRMLSLAVGSTLHAFELMLASFIAGIAFGALWIRRRADSSPSPLNLVGIMQVLMGLAALLSLALYANAFTWVGFFMESLSRTDGAYNLFNLGTAAVAILIMLPSAFFAGTTLPLFTVALLRDGQGESSIGRVYAWNTLGAIVGVFAAIHFLIPVLGLKLALAFSASIDMLIGLGLLYYCASRQADVRRLSGAAAASLLGLVLAISLVDFDPMRLSSGVYRSGQARLADHEHVLFYRDGKTASISVVVGNRGQIRIATNGKVDASLQMMEGEPPTADEPTMVMAAALPLAYKPEAREVAVIGFGSGLTTHVLLADPSLERVDTIEIEAAMVAGAWAFGDRVMRAYTDPRSHIIIDDAKSYFSGQQRRYDIIVSEPSNPWISGVGALFSKEFYEFIPRFLTEDGILLQWLQLYEIDEQLVGSVLNALIPAFHDYQAYLSNAGDLLILASPSELSRNPDFDSLFRGDMGRELALAGVPNPEVLRFRRVADARTLRALSRLYASRPNSDYFPILSINAPRTRFRNLDARGVRIIPFLDMPLLEMLGVRGVLPDHAEAPDHEHAVAETLTNQARALAALVAAASSGNGPALPSAGDAGRRFALQLLGISASCDSGWNESLERDFSHSLLTIAHATLPYLSPELQRGLLIEQGWLDCPEKPVSVIEALNVAEAFAMRDAEQMASLGLAWLETRADRSDAYAALDPLMLFTAQAGHILLRDFDAVTRIEDTYGADVPSPGDYTHMKSLLLAWLDE
ncbi:MAG: fused MFS/spermidine synthase [Wenzhouxiangella sp.]|nr:fused MFS/spermidine synthase [Wenzhouxiangella sp.]